MNLIIKAILAELSLSSYKEATEYLDRTIITITSRTQSRLQLPGAQGVITKLRIIVLWIYRSPYRIQAWKAREDKLRLPNYDVDMRWNYTLRMIDDVFNYRPTINDSCKDIEALKDMKLGNEEWNILDKIREMLRLFEKFIEYIS